MKSAAQYKAFLAATFAAGVGVGCTFGFSYLLKRSEARQSHQLPRTEILIEPPTLSSPELVSRGRKLYINSCAHCHGLDATGDEGPDLHELEFSDRYIVNTIKRGIPHEMPSFSKKLNAADLTALLAYVRGLESGN